MEAAEYLILGKKQGLRGEWKIAKLFNHIPSSENIWFIKPWCRL